MKRIKDFLPIAIYLVIIAILEIIFWNYKDGIGLGEMIFCYFILFPGSIFAISLIYSLKINSKSKYFLVLFFGISIVLFEYTTTSLANMIEFNKSNIPSITTGIICGIVSLVGILLGNLIKKYSKNK